MPIKNLNEVRNRMSLIYSPFYFYIVGGDNCSWMNSCEMLEKSSNWKRITNINTGSDHNFLAYVHPSFIYRLGGCHLVYEKLNLKNINISNWEVLQIEGSSKRYNKCNIQMKKYEIDIF